MQVACPHCQKAVLDDGSLAGQAVRCPSCGGQFAMPVPKVVTVPQTTAPQPQFPAVGQSGFPDVNTKKSSSYRVRSQPAKSPAVAAVLSFFWCGLGQLYIGEIAKGLLLMFVLPTVLSIGIIFAEEPGYFVASAVAICMWFYGMFDAYSSAGRYNRRRR